MKNNELDRKRLKAIGKHLMELRQKKIVDGKKLSQEALANLIGMEPKQYWRLEKGEEFKMTTLFRVLDYYEITLGEFFNEIK